MLVGSEMARLCFSSPRSSSARGSGGNFSSQEDICVVLSLIVENDVGGDMAMVTCGGFRENSVDVLLLGSSWQRGDLPLRVLPSRM